MHHHKMTVWWLGWIGILCTHTKMTMVRGRVPDGEGKDVRIHSDVAFSLSMRK
jgi:hypothetical protein